MDKQWLVAKNIINALYKIIITENKLQEIGFVSGDSLLDQARDNLLGVLFDIFDIDNTDLLIEDKILNILSDVDLGEDKMFSNFKEFIEDYRKEEIV